MPLSLSASYCFSFFTLARLPGIGPPFHESFSATVSPHVQRQTPPSRIPDLPSVVELLATTGGEQVLLLVLIALLALIALGVGFTVHWLFIVAVVLALVWLISFFAGASGGRSRGAWW